MITIQYFNGIGWVDCGEFYNEQVAWLSLGDDTLNYRTIDESGFVLTNNKEEV